MKPAVFKADEFVQDWENQVDWYLEQSDLDPPEAADLAQRFTDAMEQTLQFLAQNPEIGRPRLSSFSNVPGLRSWKLQKPFERFLIFYRIEHDLLNAVRLLDGHSRLAAD